MLFRTNPEEKPILGSDPGIRRDPWNGTIWRNKNGQKHRDSIDGISQPSYISENGALAWYVKGSQYRDTVDGIDQPAWMCERNDSDERVYYANGRFHRNPIDGIEQPTRVWANGYQAWWVNGKQHRSPIDGVCQPATIRGDGAQEWCVNDERHRTDGPAAMNTNGVILWRIHGRDVMPMYTTLVSPTSTNTTFVIMVLFMLAAVLMRVLYVVS